MPATRPFFASVAKWVRPATRISRSDSPKRWRRHAPTYAVIGDADTLTEIARKTIQANVKALEDTLAVLDLGAVNRAATVLLGARRVDIYGAGGGAIAALDLQYKLVRLGIRAVPHTDAEMQVVSATLLTPADVAVAISHSGESQDVARALAVAGRAGARTIAITNHPGSPLATAAQISLHTAAQESMAYGYPLGAGGAGRPDRRTVQLHGAYAP